MNCLPRVTEKVLATLVVRFQCMFRIQGRSEVRSTIDVLEQLLPTWDAQGTHVGRIVPVNCKTVFLPCMVTITVVVRGFNRNVSWGK